MACFGDLFEIQTKLMDANFGPILRCLDRMHGNREVVIKVVSLTSAGPFPKAADADAGEQRNDRPMNCSNRSRPRRDEHQDPLQEQHIVQQIQATAGHPNVVQIHEILHDRQGELLCYVMEFCGQGDLLNVMTRLRKRQSQRHHKGHHNKRFTETQVLEYFRQVVAGVMFLHNQGIAHRDLSLENVLVDDWNVCKVSDFGLSCDSNELRRDVVGKYHYMAPEVLQAPTKAYDPVLADLWSLGMVLFILLTNSPLYKMPRDGDLAIEIVKRHGITKVLQLWGMTNVASKNTLDLLNKLLRVTPSERLPLDRVLAHECFGRHLHENESEEVASFLI